MYRSPNTASVSLEHSDQSEGPLQIPDKIEWNSQQLPKHKTNSPFMRRETWQVEFSNKSEEGSRGEAAFPPRETMDLGAEYILWME